MSNIIRKKLKLYRTENVGPSTFHNLTNQYSLDEALEQVKQMAAAGGKKQLHIPSDEQVEEEIYNTEKMGGTIIDESSIFFPKLSAYQNHFPPLLSLLGNASLLKESMTAVIGTRDPSLQGIQYTRYVSEYLGKHQQVVISGFAKGIDTIAHESTLQTGTIGFLPCGIDVVFPWVNFLLYNKIKEQGLLITDKGLGQEPVVRNFPQRNKYIALMSRGVVIMEAKINSGSIMTGNLALKYQCPLFCVPGHPLDSRYNGNNYLLKKGALIMDHPQCILDYFNNLSFREQHNNMIPLKINVNHITDTMRKKVFNLISHIPSSVESICEYLGLSLGEVNYILIELELAGKIERTIDDKVSLLHHFITE